MTQCLICLVGLLPVHPVFSQASGRALSQCAQPSTLAPSASRSVVLQRLGPHVSRVLRNVAVPRPPVIAAPPRLHVSQHDCMTLARMRSVLCRPASAFLDALPVAPTPRLSDRDFRSALQLRLGLLEVLSAAIGLTCGCKRKLCETDA